MAHHVFKTGYPSLVERLNRFPQGAPPSKTLYRILEMLFSEREAELVSLLPVKPFTAQQAAERWKMDLSGSRKVLDELARRAVLLDVEQPDGSPAYVLPPPMAGFFEFALMRVRGDIDQALLSELFYQYLNVEEEFMRQLVAVGETQLGRAFVNEEALPADNVLYVLDYERASEVIRSAKYMAVGSCYCRHKMLHLARACAAPLDTCLTFGGTAASLAHHGHARQVDAVEGLDLLQQARNSNLVQFGENVREGVSFICNCCGCCCEAMIAARRYGLLHPVHTTNFLPEVVEAQCNGCGRCVTACPVEAMTLVSANDPHQPKRKKARLNADICLGCGVCTRVCPREGLRLTPRAQRVITPLNSMHRIVLMALERGKLQELIFDNRLLWSHRAMAALLGVVLNLPPLKRVLASEQVKSRYLEALLQRVGMRA